MKQARTWTKDEDSLLRDAVARQEGESTINWHEVASFIEGRNNKECRKRWVYALEPSINKGAWEPAEDERLRAGVQAHGTRWAEVSRVVGSRHPDQCSKRYHEVLKPNINRERWSLVEDTNLRRAVAYHGRKWIEIVERYFPDRTPIATRNRYFQLQKKDAEAGEAGAGMDSDNAGMMESPSSSWSQPSLGSMPGASIPANQCFPPPTFGSPMPPQAESNMGPMHYSPHMHAMPNPAMQPYFPPFVAAQTPTGYDSGMNMNFDYEHQHVHH